MTTGHWVFLGIILAVASLFLCSALRQQWTQRRYGYSVYSRGGAEDGTVNYVESGREIWLYFERASDTIYVPSDEKWREIMPPWARERKYEILPRIRNEFGKRLIGKDWTYQESSERIMPQPGDARSS